MPYYNTCRIQSPSLTFMHTEKSLSGLRLNRPVQSGFEYKNWPVIKPGKTTADFEIREIHWEYIPGYIQDEFDLREARLMNIWLTARGENLFKNEYNRISIFREGALYGRCIILSSGFFEWRHIPVIGKRGKPIVQKEKIPYFITVKSTLEYFFMAGVSRIWTNHSRNQSGDTFAIVTTEANELMAKVHNNKKRMPVILKEETAFRWLNGSLSETEITQLANYQYPAEEMTAWPVEKNFISKPNPEEPWLYENLPSL